MTARELLEREYGKNLNFMTPHVLGRGWIKPQKMAYELSTGEGIEHDQIWGVSIVSLNDDGSTKREYDLRKLFHNRDNARRYIWKLKLS